ncbi:MAG TPA: HIT family protein [Candidatus Thalassarchaeaceae archaeon]|jgi:histidine triad (HIT) family protein|nr:HIT family protein [Candidatus Thalassarchaeaceae archaeon]|tara:strand:- start:42193 stop:42618 length:426 start_codon:yes stop_codon:yes gene_type:complete
MQEDGPSIFTLIINGEIPCHKVFEDDHVIAFLDINPFSPGHTLVVPKEPAKTLDRLSSEYSEAVGAVLPRISKAVLEATGAKEFNVLQNNGPNAYQSVFHVHFHIIPKFDDGRGLSWPFKSTPIDHDEAARLAIEINSLIP